jgi:hypothetical protein
MIVGKDLDDQVRLFYYRGDKECKITFNSQNLDDIFPISEDESTFSFDLPIEFESNTDELSLKIQHLLSIYFMLSYQTSINPLKHQNCLIEAMGNLSD